MQTKQWSSCLLALSFKTQEGHHHLPASPHPWAHLKTRLLAIAQRANKCTDHWSTYIRACSRSCWSSCWSRYGDSHYGLCRRKWRRWCCGGRLGRGRSCCGGRLGRGGRSFWKIHNHASKSIRIAPSTVHYMPNLYWVCLWLVLVC